MPLLTPIVSIPTTKRLWSSAPGRPMCSWSPAYRQAHCQSSNLHEGKAKKTRHDKPAASNVLLAISSEPNNSAIKTHGDDKPRHNSTQTCECPQPHVEREGVRSAQSDLFVSFVLGGSHSSCRKTRTATAEDADSAVLAEQESGGRRSRSAAPPFSSSSPAVTHCHSALGMPPRRPDEAQEVPLLPPGGTVIVGSGQPRDPK